MVNILKFFYKSRCRVKFDYNLREKTTEPRNEQNAKRLALFYPKHYANMPMEYIAIFFTFYVCKTGNFQMKKCDNFLIFAQNIDCGYTLASVRRF